MKGKDFSSSEDEDFEEEDFEEESDDEEEEEGYPELGRPFSEQVTFLISYLFRMSCQSDIQLYSKYARVIAVDLRPITMAFSDWVDYPDHSYTFHNLEWDIISLAISEDGRHVFAGSKQGWILHLNIECGRVIDEWAAHTNKDETQIHDLAYKSDTRRRRHCRGVLASASSDCTIRIWNAHNNRGLITTLVGHSSQIVMVRFHDHNSDLLISGSWDNTLRLWSIEKSECMGIMFGHRKSITRAIFFTDHHSLRSLVISASCDRTLKVWDTGDVKKIVGSKDGSVARVSCVDTITDRTLMFFGINDVHMNSDQSLLVCVSNDVLILYQWPGLQLYFSYQTSMYVECLRFYPGNEDLIAMAVADGGVQFVEPTKEKTVLEYQVSDRVPHLAFTPGGSRLVLALPDQALGVWDVSELVKPKKERSQQTALKLVSDLIRCV